jgi:hypothetical protein
MSMNETTDRLDSLRKIFRSWFELTQDEQKVLLLILALFLLGLFVRWRHLRTERPDYRSDPLASGQTFLQSANEMPREMIG